MTRNLLNFLIDAITAAAMLAMIATGLVIRYVLPPGTGGRLSVWGWGRHDWGEVHFWLAVAVGALLVLHVALHWSWVCGTAHRMLMSRPVRTARTRPWQRHIAGGVFVASVVALVGGFVWIASRNVEGGSGVERRGPQRVRASAIAPVDEEADAGLTDRTETPERRRRRGR